MATSTDPKQRSGNPGQKHSDDRFDFSRYEDELKTHDKDLDSLGNADSGQEDENIGRARQMLSEKEGSAGGDKKQQAEPAAEREKYPDVAYRGGEDDDDEKVQGKKRSRLKAWMITSAIVTLIGGGAAFYSAVTGLQRDLIEQATHATRQAFSRMYQQSIRPYIARYLAKYVFANHAGIADCAGETGTIVTKDCFYRHKSSDYPRTFVGRAYQAWKDGRLEKRLFGDTIGLSYNPDAILDPSTGKRGPLWILTAPEGEYTIDATNPDADTHRLFTTTEFTAGTGLHKTALIADHVMEVLERETHAGFVDKARARAWLYRKFGLKGCNFYCRGKTRIDSTKSKLADFREYTRGLIALKIFPKKIGVFLACFMSKRDYACLESDSKFQQRFGESTDGVIRGDGSSLDNLLKLADEAKRDPNLTTFIIKKVLVKLAEKISPTLASFATEGIPIAGQIITAIAAGWSIFSTGVMIYYVHNFLSGPQGQFALTMIKAEAFSGAFSLISLSADERNGAKQVYDHNADSAYAELLDGYEHSLVWQSQYGNVEGLKDYKALFTPTAYAGALPDNEYPNVCNDDGDRRPVNSIICPQMQFDYKPPVIAAAQATALSGSPADVGDAVASFGDSVADVVNAPFDAASEAVLETQYGKDAMDALRAAINPLIQPAIDQVLTPPYDGPEDIKGAKLLDGAWGGGDWTQNDMARGGLNPDGSPIGWGRLLTDTEVADINNMANQDIEKEFANLPIWDRIFSTKYSQSFASRFAFSAPQAVKSPFQFVSSILSPLTGMRFAALTETAHAGITQNSNFFHIPRYGATLGEISAAPLVDENAVNPCPNDRTPPEIGAPGTIDRGLGRAEITSFNSCLLAKSSLERFSAYDSNEPLDPTAASASASLGAGAAGVATGTWIWPIAEDDYSHDSSCWGEWRTGADGQPYQHAGLDILGKLGDGKTRIVAVDGGTVMTATNSVSAGGLVIIKHGTGVYSMYMHMDPARLEVNVGDQVGQGALLGYQSHYGHVIPAGPGGSHLHFTASKTGFNRISETVNPLSLLPLTGQYKARTSCSV